MANSSEKRRAWVKNAAIIFLTILLLLTFFSNTILNYSLPEVSAQYANSGTLTTAVKVDGTVKANASYNVIYEADQAEAENGVIQSRKVVSVYVREGDFVAKDAPILELQGGMSDQLKAVQAQYEEAKRAYDLALLQDTVDDLNSNKTLSDAKKSIEDAKKKLAELQAEYSAVVSGADVKSVIEAKIEALEGELEALEETLASETEAFDEQYTLIKNLRDEVAAKIQTAEGMIEKDIFSTLTVAEKFAAAKAEYEDAEFAYLNYKADAEYYKEQLDEIKASSEDLTEANALTTQLKSLEDQLASLEKQFERAEEDYLESRSDILTDIYEASLKLKEEMAGGASGDSSEYSKELGGSEAGVSITAVTYPSQSVISGLYDQLDALDKAYDRSSEDALEQIEDVEEKIEEIENKLYILGMPEVDDLWNYAAGFDLTEAQKSYDEAAARLAESEKTYEAAKAKYESLTKQNMASESIEGFQITLEVYEGQLSELETARKTRLKEIEDEKKAKNKDLEAARKELSSAAVSRDPKDVAAEIESTKNSIASLETQLAITEASQNKSDAETKLSREDQKKQLEELEAKIEAFTNAPATTSVTAPIAGRIVSVNYVPGDTVTSGNTVASIEIADQGYVCEISLAAEEARKIQVGAPCTIVNNWWYNNIEASVKQIRSDPQSQGKKRIIVIEVKGDSISEGQSLKFSIGDKSQSYDIVLPNSAIREDNNGKFVLVVEAKNSALGTKYTARRVDIEVIASDDTRSAVSGLYGSEFVITGSKQPITDNQRVRLAESN